MSNFGGGNSTEELLKELLATVNTLKKDVSDLKAKDDGRSYPQKRLHDGESEGDGNESHDGDNGEDRDGDLSDTGEVESDGSHATQFTISEEGEAFLEATFDSHLDYKNRKKQIAKYGEPDSKWTICPTLSPVVAATLPSAAIKDDKVAFRTQQMYMEAVTPLAALLESTGDETFTIKEAISMVQSAIRLLGDATQHHSSLRRKAIMQHLNPQLQTLMKDVDFKGSQPLLFVEDFGEKAKTRIEAAAALRKVVNSLGPKGKHVVFRKATLSETPGAPGWQDKTLRPHQQVKEGTGSKELTRKVLTRTFECVSTSCFNFKYNCEPYPLINTGDCSKAPPRGVDWSDEPDHHQSHVGWKTNPVHNKLGENNSRLMGLASHKGIPTRIGSTTLANEANASNKLLCRGVGNDLFRNQTTAVQGCSGRDHTFPGRLCITNLPGRKEGGETEVGNKPEGTQHVCGTGAFQNGGTTHPSRPHPAGGLDDKTRPEGCLPSGTNPCRASTTPPVPIRTQNLPISVPPIRVDICSTGCLQNKESHSGSTSAHGNTSSHILDDILVLHGSMEKLAQLTPLICQLFEALGLVVNQKKLIPHQTLEFLGFQVDTVSLQLIFPSEKLRKIQQLAQHLLHQPSVSVRDLARFVGKASASTRAIWQAPLHFRALQFLINSVPLENHHMGTENIAQKFRTNLTLTKEAKDNLKWWCALDRKVRMQSPLQPRVPTMTIESDASNMGWGA